MDHSVVLVLEQVQKKGDCHRRRHRRCQRGGLGSGSDGGGM
jgi:hypothetical protein